MSRAYLDVLDRVDLVARTGRVRKILPTYIEADGPDAPRGALCTVQTTSSTGSVLAQIVGVRDDAVILVPFEDGPTTFAGARVEACAAANTVPVGDAFLGRVIDAMGRPLDAAGPIKAAEQGLLSSSPTPPLDRCSPGVVLETGVRAIDGLLTLGLGQRVGVFAASGVGKTSLMAQLANQTAADRCILCLVGERGREIEALWSGGLNAQAKARTTVVAATSDQAAVMRVRAVDYALALADHWRQSGQHVLLFIDSVTRYTMALREIGLAAGEPPTVRAYTPSVFAIVPKVVERCGALKSGGSISAVMTVLTETDDNDDPIAEMMKSLLDGHIVLSRKLAEKGHFPAIDVPRSISRLARSLMEDAHHAAAEHAIGALSTYETSRLMIETGVYAGGNAEIDQAIALRPALMGFLKQKSGDRTSLADTRARLGHVLVEAS